LGLPLQTNRKRRISRRKIVALSLLVTIFILISAIHSTTQPAVLNPDQPSEPNSHPELALSPPNSLSGKGVNISSVMSFNGWNSTKLKANNTRSSYQTRSASYSPLIPAGYTTVWQNITISNLTAVYDARAIEGGSFSATWLAKDIGNYSQFAMRFTTVDKANLTGVWLNYALSGIDPVKLHVVSTGTTSSTTPSGGTNIGEATLPTGTGWSYVTLNPPVTISRGNYYWIVVNASSINTTQTSFGWRYRYDQGTGTEDLILAAGQRWIVSNLQWRDEADFTSYISKYINFLSVLKVLPVDSSDVSKVKTYASPSHVAMNETNSGISLLGNTTNIPVTTSTFSLKTNTSVTFTANWTARFANTQTWNVATNYKALNGTTFWNATFASDRRPSGVLPKTVYNRTITVSPISANWTFADLTKNITNAYTNATKTYNINFTATLGSNYIFITQTDNVNRTDVWMANWTIKAKSPYSITALIPSQAIQWKPFNVTVSAKLLPSNRTLLIYNRTGDTAYNKTFYSVSTSPVNYPVTLNASGNYNIIVFERVFDRIAGRNEANFFNASWITVLKPLTRMSLNATTVSATWGDTIYIKVNFQNATGSVVSNFTSAPSFTVGSYTPTPSTPWGNNGSYVLDYPSTLQSSAGTYPLWVNGSYPGGYHNETQFTLNLAKVPMNVTIVACQDEVLPGSSLNVTAKLTYERNGTTAPDGSDLRFNFTITYLSAPSEFTIKDEVTSQGNATASLSVTSTMRFISVNVSYAGNSIRGGDYDVKTNIVVLEKLTQMSLNVTTTVDATWGDMIHIKVTFLNATGGVVKPFPSSPMPTFTVGGDTITPWLPWVYNGSYMLNYSSSLLSSAGTYNLRVNGTYSGGYDNRTMSFTLNLTKIQMAVSIVPCQGAVLPYSSLAVSASLTYGNGSAVPNGFTLRFNFMVTYTDSSQTTITKYGVTANGAAMVSLVATTEMSSISVNVSYAGDPIRTGAFDEQTGISVPPLRTQISLESDTINATWSDQIHIRIEFLNATQGATNEFPSALSPVFNVSYPSGYVIPSVLNEGAGWYSFNVSSRLLSSAGSKQLNITATYQEIYTNATTLSLHLDWIPMTLKLTLGQINVTAGSSLSVSATLKYPNGTAMQNFKVVFRFNVTYSNGTTSVFNINASTLNGEATYGFPTTADMQSISVAAIYEGDEIRALESTENQVATVIPRSSGFPVIMLGAAGGFGALAVVGVVMAVRKRRRGKEVEYKKTAALRQAASLAQLVVVDRKSGRAVFSRNLSTEETVDPHLISGFLSANESVLQEVFRGDKECLRYADYGKYKVITCIGENVMTTLFCAVGADRQLEGVLELEDVLGKFTKEFERRYGRLVSVWDGDMVAFRGAESIVSDVFAEGISMLSPYTLDRVALARAKLSGLENDAFQKADRLSSGREVFFITKVIEYLLAEKRVARGKAMDTIDSLIKKGVFKQISMSEAEEAVRKASSSST
jgi:hypothetical protein